MSTAYYALFHRVLRAGVERFMGAGHERSAGYALLYRSFGHGRMKAVCEALGAAALKDSLKKQLGRSAVGQNTRDFANAFVVLQEARHLADYDPLAVFWSSDATELVEAADYGMAAFDRIAPDERADVLALMLIGARS